MKFNSIKSDRFQRQNLIEKYLIPSRNLFLLWSNNFRYICALRMSAFGKIWSKFLQTYNQRHNQIMIWDIWEDILTKLQWKMNSYCNIAVLEMRDAKKTFPGPYLHFRMEITMNGITRLFFQFQSYSIARRNRTLLFLGSVNSCRELDRTLPDTYTIAWGSHPAVWRRFHDVPSFWLKRSPELTLAAITIHPEDRKRFRLFRSRGEVSQIESSRSFIQWGAPLSIFAPVSVRYRFCFSSRQPRRACWHGGSLPINRRKSNPPFGIR
jgi:hypothetical protein